MKVPCKGAPQDFSESSGPKNSGNSIFLAPMCIVELFASHVPRRMQIPSFGDDVEGHCQTNFLKFFKKFSS